MLAASLLNMSDHGQPSAHNVETGLTIEQHRALAIRQYNRCQDLFYSERDAAADREMLTAALTSRYHWLIAGGPTQWTTADWCVSRVLVALGAAELAVQWSETSMTHDHTGFPVWRQASALEGLARAYAAAGRTAEAVETLARARGVLADEPNPNEVAVIADQIADVQRVLDGAA